jgi:plasmid stabilization system protein ParE
MPDMGAPKRFKNPLLAGLRSWPVKGFEDIRIYYLVKGGVLRVIRVLHGERDVQRILQDDGGGVQ